MKGKIEKLKGTKPWEEGKEEKKKEKNNKNTFVFISKYIAFKVKRSAQSRVDL